MKMNSSYGNRGQPLSLSRRSAGWIPGVFICLAQALLTHVQAQDPFTNGLMAYYPFNGNANDASGNGHNGVAFGLTSTTDRFGTANRAYRFNGTNGYVWIGSGVRPPVLTACAWFKTTAIVAPGFANVQIILRDRLYGWQLGVTATNNGWGQPVGALVASFYRSEPGGPRQVTFFRNDKQFNDGNWHFVALTYDGTNASLYSDGEKNASEQFSTNANVYYQPTGGGLAIGRDGDSSNGYFDGNLDDIRLYDRGLSAEEVLHLYYTENPQPPAITTHPSSRAVVAGSSLQFSVSAYGPAPLSYQWRRNGAALSGFTNRICTLVGVFTNDVGDYSVTVSNAFGATTSSNASLAVSPVSPPPPLAGPITNAGNGHLYYLLDMSTWVEAEAAAVAFGGHLAIVRNQAEQDWIYATFANYGGNRRDVRIGLYDTDPLHNSTNTLARRGEFAWVSGEPVTFTRWYTNEPNNALDQGEFYGMIWGFSANPNAGYWNDIWDSDPNFNHGLAEVPLGPVIVTNQPAARTNVATSSISFAAIVSGMVPLTYQWWKGAEVVPGQTNRVCTLVGVQSSDAGVYSLVVSNAFGVVTGAVGTLTVLPLTPPTVLAGPVTNPANDHVYFLLNQSSWVEAEAAAVALGGHLATIRSQAEQDWVFTMFGNYGGVSRNIHIGFYDPDPVRNSTVRGARMSEFVWVSGEPVTYMLWHPGEPNNYYESEFYVHMWGPGRTDWPAYWNDLFDSRASDNYGVAEVIVPPSLTLQPTNQIVIAGSNVVFAASANGSKPLSYQWTLNGTNLPSGTQSVLNLTNVSAQDGGTYVVLVSNTAASVPSAPAFLDVRYSLAYGNGGLMLGSNYTFIGSVNLSLWSVFLNANIFYTLDGSAPSFASDYYAGPFNLNRTATLRVIAYSADFFQAAEAPPIYLTVIPIYALNLISPGGGNITADPPTSPYASNTVVTLTAQPSNGWTFLEWRGDASGANPSVDVTMNRPKTVQAIFGTTLGTTVAGNGAVDVHPALPLYPYGTVARLTAIPQPGNYFGVWGNAASGNTNPLYFAVIGANPVVSSLFGALGANQYALIVIPDGFGKMTVTPRANVYATGAGVSINAVPDPGQEFLGWSGDASGTQNPLLISMTASKTIIATFTRKPSLIVDSPLNGLFEDGFRLTLRGEFGQAYRIDASTNLVGWSPLTTITNIYGTTQFTDETATNAERRFYRALRE